MLPVILLAAGCSVEETYEKGQQEDPDCYGVYFPSQTASTSLFLESDDPTEVSYRVRRTSVLDEITVPLVITASADGIFEADPLVFGAGEDEAVLTIRFPKAEIGTEYTCSIRIEDPRYVSIYGNRNAGMSFSVLRADWISLGTGKWRDDIFTSMYNVTNPNAEIDVEIFQREDQEGYYRVTAFTPALIEALFGMSVQTQELSTIIDATDPDAVWIPVQETGVQLSSNDGYISIGSFVSENFSMDDSESQYGSMENGVITFPAQSIGINFSAMGETWYYCNTNGMQRIMLPGARVYEYTVTMTKSEPADGTVNINAQLSSDVSMMGYKVYEGEFDDAQASLNAQEMAEAYASRDPKAFDGIIYESGNLAVRCPLTGKYTMVCCLYGSGSTEMQGYGFITFGYVAQGDDKPVILTAGLEGTNEYAGMGFTTDNSVKFYAYGEEIEKLDYGIFKSADIQGYDYGSILDASGTHFTEEQLADLNGGHFSTLLTGLNGDSDYTLLVRADNGYYSRMLTAEYSSTGVFDPALEVYEYSDFLASQPSKNDLFGKTWNYYAMDLMDENPIRKKIGQVTISDNAEDQSGWDFINVHGITGIDFESETDGTMLATYIPGSAGAEGYNGALALYTTGESIGTYEGQTLYSAFIAEEDGQAYNGMCMFGGAVADGYIYFVPSPPFVDQNLTFSYLYTGSSTTSYTLLTEMILVDPEKDLGRLPDGTASRIAALRRNVRAMYDPHSFTALPFMWNAPAGSAAGEELPVNLAGHMIPASAPQSKPAGAQVTFSAEVLPVSGSAEGGFVRKSAGSRMVTPVSDKWN